LKASLLNIFGKPSEKEKVKLNSKAFTFLTCLLLAAFFWLISALSKEYTSVIVLPIKYTGLPANKVVANKLPLALQANIRASGFTLLELGWKRSAKFIVIDAGDARPLRGKKVYLLPTAAITEKIAMQLGKGIKVSKILPDSVVFNYNKKTVKKVPVIADVHLTFAGQHQLSDSISVVPAEVEIAGEQSLINRIAFVKTKLITLDDISKSKEVKALLDYDDLDGVDINAKSVVVRVPVAEFTEGSIELPITAINLPKGYKIKTFPDKVVVKYRVNIRDYEKINPSMFSAVIDYKKGTNNRLKVDLAKSPSIVKFAKVVPEKVEFIIKK